MSASTLAPVSGMADAIFCGDFIVGPNDRNGTPSFFNATASLFAWIARSLARNFQGQPRFLPRMLFGARTTRPLLGLIWPEDGCASIA